MGNVIQGINFMKKPLKAILVIVAIFAFVSGCEPKAENGIEVQPEQKAAVSQEPIAVEPNRPVAELQEEPPEKLPSLSYADEFNSAFSPIFESYVDENGLVNYSKLRRMRLILNSAIKKLSGLERREYDKWNREEKIAFWINAYNIFTLKTVIDNYPIKPVRYKLLMYPANSIRHISNFWGRNYFNVMGTQYTLREIERDVLLKEFSEAKICFAVSYATGSSASLRNEPYLGINLNEQFDEQTEKFFAKTSALKIDSSARIVYISTIFSIFDWHKEAFLNQYGTNKNFREQKPIDRAALNCIKNYISKKEAEYLLRQKYEVKYIKYDWTLNDQNK